MKKSTSVASVAPPQDNNSSLDSSKGMNNNSVQNPDTGLLSLIKERLKTDFYYDPFDQPKLQGTPPKRELVQFPQKKSRSIASNEPYFRITPSDFSGYKLQLMSPPLADNQIAKRTLYLECDNDELICTVCDSHRTITESIIHISELRKLGVNISTPLKADEITPMVPHILTILKICDLKEEKQDLAKKTQEINKPDYLERFCESVVMQIYQEQTILSQMMRRELAPENPIKQKYQAIDKEISDFLALIKPESLVEIIQDLSDTSKGKYTKLDIVTVVRNILIHKIESFSEITTSLKKEVLQQIVQQEPRKPMQTWTHREGCPAETSKNSSADEFGKKPQEDNGSKNFHL